ncbi:MAG: hypothetical protein H6728_15940 [Myxococcales bacterium]|nr:hypothetical protein [Myxococcales bacterium]MCB9644565.1 hypothetical protein [Myxococcales bacterium]
MRVVFSCLFSLILASLLALGLHMGLHIRIVDKPAFPDLTKTKLDVKGYNPLIIGDIGSAGYPRDRSLWFSDYSHHGRQFSTLFQKDAPFFHAKAFAQFKRELKMHLAQSKRYGFNAIEIPGFIELVDFRSLKDPVYPKGSVYRKRHKAFRERFREIFQIAQEMGLQVILKTDMVTLSKPLERYLEKKGIGKNVDDPRFWAIYEAGMDELFASFPQVKGVIIRIGEAGAIYSQAGWDYWSELLVLSKKSVERMLQTFLKVAEKHHRKLIFRSWAVGIGEVGKIHTVPSAYQAVLDKIDSKAFYVSTKYSRGDFWSYLPLNPTLFQGRHQRIVEFQSRREFEAFNAFVNYAAPTYQNAYKAFYQKNPKVAGAWIWTQSGGPMFQAPFTFYLQEGSWVWIDANLYATARVIREPNVDIRRVTDDWVRETFGEDAEVRREMAHILFASHEATRAAVTFKPFAGKQVFALGQEVPTVAFSYWNIVGGNSGIFSSLYVVAREQLDKVLQEDEKNCEVIADLGRRFSRIKGRITKHRAWIPHIEKSFAYMHDLALTLSAYRRFFLRYFQWLDGRGEAKAYQEALALFQKRYTAHQKAYKGNIHFPAYLFTEAMRLVDYAQKTGRSMWLARLLLLLGLGLLFWLWKNKTQLSQTSLSFPRFALLSVGLLGYILLTCLAFSSFRGIFFASCFVGLAVIFLAASWFFFAVSPRGFGFLSVPIFALGSLLLAMPAMRGPMSFWLMFWTAPLGRALFVVGFFGVVILSYSIVLWGQSPAETAGKTSGGLPRAQGATQLRLRLACLVGLQFLATGLLMLGMGLDPFLTTLNNELAVLPYFLTLIHGLVVHLNIPTVLPFVFVAPGVLLLLVGGLGFRKRTAG